MTRSIPQTQRRIAVLVQLVCFPALVLMGYWLQLATALVVVVGLLVWLAVSVYLFWGTGLWHYGNAPDDQLDERQAQVRNYAYRLAYMVASVLLLSLLFYALVGADLGWPRLTTYASLDVFFWEVFLLLLTLPSVILAWIEADYPID